MATGKYSMKKPTHIANTHVNQLYTIMENHGNSSNIQMNLAQPSALQVTYVDYDIFRLSDNDVKLEKRKKKSMVCLMPLNREKKIRLKRLKHT